MSGMAALRAQRGEKYAQLQAMLVGENDEPKTELSAEETIEFDALEVEVKALDTQIEAMGRRLASLAALAKVNGGGEDSGGPAPFQPRATVHPEPKVKEEPGTEFARIVRAMAAGGGNRFNAAQAAVHIFPGDTGARIAASLQAGQGPSGGFLVPPEISTEILTLLRNRTVMRRAGVLTVPMVRGVMQMPRQTAGTSGAYIGELQNIPVSEPKFAPHNMVSRKLSVLVPISNDLMRAASPAVDGLVRNDIVAGFAVTEDAFFLRGDGVGANPMGIRNWAIAANVSASAGSSMANIEADVAAMQLALQVANIPMTNMRWIMHPRTKSFLMDLRDVNGNVRWPSIETNNTLRGYPIETTNQVPANLGGGSNESEIYLADFSDFVIGEEMQLEIAVSDVAPYQDGGQMVSAFQTDQTLIRAIAKHDFMARRPEAIAVRTGVTY